MRRYHYSLDDQTKVGPVTLETLRAKAVAGELKPQHFVFTEGADQWTEARHIDGLFPGAAPDTGKPAAPSRPDRPRPSGLRRINSGEYASTPRPKHMAIARGLYGPPEPAPLRYRAAAAFFDGVIVLALLGVVVPATRIIADALTGGSTAVTGLGPADLPALIVTPWLYFAGMECSVWQGTLAKKALTMRVVDSQGRRITFGRATIRHFAKALSILPVGAGFFWAWLSPSLRTWHDRLTRTAVQRTPPV